MKRKKLLIYFLAIILIFTILVGVGCKKKPEESEEVIVPEKAFFEIMKSGESKTDNYICEAFIDDLSQETIKLTDKNNFISERGYVKDGKILGLKPGDEKELLENSEIETIMASQLKVDYLKPLLTEFTTGKLDVDGVEHEVVIGKGMVYRSDLDYIPMAWYEKLDLGEGVAAELKIIYDVNSKNLIEQSMVADKVVLLKYSSQGRVSLDYPAGLKELASLRHSQDFESSGATNALGRVILAKLPELNNQSNRVITPIIISNILYGGFSQGVFYPVTEAMKNNSALADNVMAQPGMTLYAYSYGGAVGERTILNLELIDNIMNDTVEIMVNTDYMIIDDYFSANRLASYLENPYPGEVVYQDNKVLVDLDNNGTKDLVTLTDPVVDYGDPLHLKKDMSVALNGGAKKPYTNDTYKVIFLDAIDIDSDGNMEILAFHVHSAGSGYASLVMFKYVGGNVEMKVITQI